MTTANQIDIASEHRRIALDVLDAYLPTDARVWAFGSRVNGRARRYSDLDLAIDAGRRLTIDERAVLQEAFDDQVDVIGWQAISAEFRNLIAADRRPLARSPTAA